MKEVREWRRARDNQRKSCFVLRGTATWYLCRTDHPRHDIGIARFRSLLWGLARIWERVPGCCSPSIQRYHQQRDSNIQAQNSTSSFPLRPPHRQLPPLPAYPSLPS